MMLWFLFAVMTAAVLAIALKPLTWPSPASSGATAATPSAIAIYRAQLAEIDDDLERGTLKPEEAEAARIELSRRLLKVADAVMSTAPQGLSAVSRSRFQLVAALAVPIIVLPLYLGFGTPNPQPVGDTAGLSGDALIAQVEARLKAAPEDGRGWDVIAPIYRRIGRYPAAAEAYAKAARLLGDSPERAEGEAESLILAANGSVPPQAIAALNRALAQEPQRVRPRFWLAVAAEQNGSLDAAQAGYAALLAEQPADQALRQLLAQRLAGLGAATAAIGKGPSDADIAGAAQMTEADRTAMITGMVEGLAARLATNGRDAEGWQKLIRAYVVLGERDKALAALASARTALGTDALSLGAVNGLAAELKLIP